MHLAYCISRCFQALSGVLKVLMCSAFFDASVNDTLGTKNSIGFSFDMGNFHFDTIVGRFKFSVIFSVGLELSLDVFNKSCNLCVLLEVKSTGGRGVGGR